METHAEMLRRRIAYYRRVLHEGVDAAFAREYLRQIAADEAELRSAETETKRQRVGCGDPS